MFKNRAIEILKNKYGVIGAILVSLLFFVLLYKYKLLKLPTPIGVLNLEKSIL